MISAVDIEGARQNLKQEIGNKSFEEVKKELVELKYDLGNRQRPKQTKRKTR